MKRHTLPGSVVVFAIAVGLSGGPAASGQTLGEVAKKEADRRKAQPQTGKVYTNKDLPASAQKPATANPSTETPAQTPTDPVAAATGQKAEDAKAPGDKPQGDQKDQAYWKNRMATAREELRRSEMFAEALQTRVNTLNKDFNSRDNPAQRSAIGADRTEALNELTRVKQDVERGKKQIADIEEEARKAGVPPGWVR
jgi:hypothetical protein